MLPQRVTISTAVRIRATTETGPMSSSPDSNADSAEPRDMDSRARDQPASSEADAFDRMADEAQLGVVREFVDFALENKKWWLLPIMLVLLLVAAFIFISGAAGPFIYPLF